MSNKQRVRPTIVPAGADDLQTIDGIGPGIESRLYSANIRTYAQLANLSPSDIAPLVAGIAGMSIDRIVKQDWIGQARKLMPNGFDAQQLATSADPIEQPLLNTHESPLSSAAHHPYATFTVELLLDEDNNVRRTRAKHVQGGTEDSWAGWHAARLTDSLIRQGSLRVPSEEQAALVTESSAESTEVVLSIQQPVAIGAKPAEGSAEVNGVAESPVALSPQPMADDSTTAPLHSLGISLAGAAISRHMLQAGQSFTVDLLLDIAGMAIPAGLPLRYIATLSAKKVGIGQRLALGEASGTILAKDSPTITIESNPLLRGIYRVEAAVTLKLPEQMAAAAADVSALLEGNLIQVY